MPVHQIDAENGLFYRHTPPARDGGLTMVFFNALTSDTGMWEGTIGESLRIEGHGTLSFNFRGQAESPFSCEVAIDAATIIADARSLIAALKPGRVVLCGLSIGGLFAAQAWRDGLAGAEVAEQLEPKTPGITIYSPTPAPQIGTSRGRLWIPPC